MTFTGTFDEDYETLQRMKQDKMPRQEYLHYFKEFAITHFGPEDTETARIRSGFKELGLNGVMVSGMTEARALDLFRTMTPAERKGQSEASFL